MVYALFPDNAEKAVNAKHQYVNGHFCYAYKAGIVTDGLGIIRHISFFDDDFREKPPEVNTPKSDNPDVDKEIGDSAFDSYDNYSMLKKEFNFERACIPLNRRNPKTIKADLYLAGCAQLIGVILAKAIHQDNLYKSVRKIVAMAA